MNCNWKFLLGLLCVVFVSITLLVIFLSTKSDGGGGGGGGAGKSETGSNRRATSTTTTTNLAYSESELRTNGFVNSLNEKLIQECERHAAVVWNAKLQIPDANRSRQAFLDSLAHRQRFISAALQSGANLHAFDTGWRSYQNETLKSLVHQILVSGTAAAAEQQSDPNESRFFRLTQFEQMYRHRIAGVVGPLLQQMSDAETEEGRQGGPNPSTYAAHIQLKKKIWLQFHNEMGEFVRDEIYPETMQLLQRELWHGRSNGNNGHALGTAAEEEFTTFASYYHTMQSELETILEKIRPLYTLLHAHVRGKSREQKEAHAMIAANGSVPLHIISAFGNWAHYKDDGALFDQIQMTQITNNIRNKKMSSRRLLGHVNELFLSLNLTTGDYKGFPESFWSQYKLVSRSVYDDSGDYEANCDGVLDVCRADNYKTVFCDDVSYWNFRDFHIKLGSIKYMMLAKPGLCLLGNGINPILLRANGMVWNLLSASPQYLDRLGLWQNDEWRREESLPHDSTATLNFQYNQALAILPRMVEFIAQQKWLASNLAGKSEANASNCEYWRLREELEGVQPPEMRRSSQMDGFAALKNLRKAYEAFIGDIIGFQLHRALCEVPDEYVPLGSSFTITDSTANQGPTSKPLQQCDITNSSFASKLLLDFMSKETTKTLRDILYHVTGSAKISVDALLDYFKPLYRFLSSNNLESNFPIGWDNKMNNYPSCI